MKLIGALILVAASYFCGRSLAALEGSRIRTVESLIAMLRYMRRRMSGERMPLYKLFAAYEDEFLEETGFLPIMRSCRNGSKTLWDEATALLTLDEDIRREMRLFGSELGTLSLEEQLKRLDALLDALEESRERLSQALPAKQKSVKTVCLLFGMLTAILLI